MTTHSFRHLSSELGRFPLLAGKYARMFPQLPPHECDEEALLALGRSGAMVDAAMGPGGEAAIVENPRIPSGFTYFGQFIAHDITADHSLLRHHTSVDQIHNIRTPRFDLECLYAAGPLGNPYLYDLEDPDKFLLGINDAGQPDDLPRNSQGIALIGDPRDDQHVIISQMHLAFLKFHNRVIDLLREQGLPRGEVFDEAQRLVRWHYQWIVAHEYLPLTVGEALVEDILTNGWRYYAIEDQPFIPIEFADGAFRFGHSQIRPDYRINDQMKGRMFPDLGGSRPIPARSKIDWRYFFVVDSARPPVPGKRIDGLMAHTLLELPASVVGVTEVPGYESLANRDLVRARSLDLPSGEAVARYMEVEPLTPEEVGIERYGWSGETPLWYYVLKEAEIRQRGERLGEVGGRIVAEVLLGLLDGDPTSVLRADE
jgi:hypothetical protein